jgi:hypothetical protein
MFAASPPRWLVAPATFLLLALSLGALPDTARAQTDVIRGRVTSADGRPIPGVRVTATSIPGNVTREQRTNNSGNYQIVFPGGTGDYIMGFAIVGYNFRQFQIKRLLDEDVLVADARMAPVALDTVTITAAGGGQQQRVMPGSAPPDVGGTDRAIAAGMIPPEVMGDIAAMAASLPGVLLLPGLDGAADAFSVFGLGGDQNSVTLNGMEMGANGLPRDAGISSSLTTSPFDASRGGFSGGNFNVSSRPGSNFVSRGLSFVTTAPQFQWTDLASRALGNENTRYSLGGAASGPIVLNQAFYNVSFEAGRNASNNQSLLTLNQLALLTAGISADSVNRLVSILDGRAIPTTARGIRNNRVSDNGSVFGSVDYSPLSSAAGHSYNLTFNGNWGRTSPAGGGATQLASASGERLNWGGGLQGRHSAYLGMILTETSAGVNTSRNYGDPYLDLPSGRVRVSSVLESGSSVKTLGFGGDQNLSAESRSINGTLQNALSWFDDANKHRLKLTTEARYSRSTSEQSSNLLGSFFFNSLADLDAGRPASFSRALTARERTTGQVAASMSLTDSYRHNPNLNFQFGVRVDGFRFTSAPEYNPLVEAAFGLRNDRIPTPLAVSPRIGFSWTLGQSNEIAAFTGAFRPPRAVIRGGIGVFSNNLSAGTLGSLLDTTGLPSGARQLNCVGAAAPTPDWAAYAADPSTIPTECVDGSQGTVFASSLPNVSLISPEFKPSKSVRSNLSWSGSILDARFTTRVEGTYSLNLNQSRTVDINFDPTVRFTLPDELDRPVYVQPTSIVQGTGSIASRDARISNFFSRVSETRSDLQSRSAQLMVSLNPLYRTPNPFRWGVTYTYSHIREQVPGFTSTAGDPTGIDWARSGQGPHQFSYNLAYNFFNAVQVSWNGSIRSGSAFTPSVGGDINGDGYSNDRAFVYDPAEGTNPALADQMQQLIEGSSGMVRSCLAKQLGRIAERNSCQGPWSTNGSISFTLDRVKFRMPQRGSIQFSISNPLGAADLLVNGSGNLRGWGQSPFFDQSLLYVRGFDANRQQYRYEVNQRFGVVRKEIMTLSSPVTLTASMKFDLGPVRERQALAQQLARGRTQPGTRSSELTLRLNNTNAVSNPLATILRQQDSLRLTSLQADSIASMNRTYMYRVDSLWSPVARFLATLPTDFEESEAFSRYMEARRTQFDFLMRIGPLVRELLTAEQRRKLPISVINSLDPRYLAAIRGGTPVYLGGGAPGFAGMSAAMMSEMAFTSVIVR